MSFNCVLEGGGGLTYIQQKRKRTLRALVKYVAKSTLFRFIDFRVLGGCDFCFLFFFGAVDAEENVTYSKCV